MGHVHEEIEGREINDRSPRPRGLPHNKKPAVETEGRQRSKLHSTLGYKSLSDLTQRHPFGGQRVIRWHGDGNPGQRRVAEEGNTVTEPQHLHYPGIRTPVPPGLPMEGQTASGQGQER